MNALPEELRLTTNVLPDQQRQRYEQGYLANYVNPQIAQLQASLFKQGRADSSFGGAQLGQMAAQGAYQGMMAGEQLYQNRLDQLLAKRASFFGNEGQMAQTSNLQDVQRGQQIADRSQRDNQFQNQFNLDAFRANLQAAAAWNSGGGGSYGGGGGRSFTQTNTGTTPTWMDSAASRVGGVGAPVNLKPGFVRSGHVNTPSIDGLVHGGGGNGWYY